MAEMNEEALLPAAQALYDREMARGKHAQAVMSAATGKPCLGAADMEPFDDHREIWLGDARAAITAYTEALQATKPDAVAGERAWHLGSMNDGLFIIDTPSRPSTDDVWHDRPDGPTLVLNVSGLSQEQAQAIVDAHNASMSQP